jgi:uncharacterized protein (DUF169 family)
MNLRGAEMSSILRDLSVFNKFNFERKPVGVKYLLNKPDGIEMLEKNLDFCEMFKEAQESSPFYIARENFAVCQAGPLLLGMMDPDPIKESGQMASTLGILKEPRAGRRIYQYIPRLARNSVNYVAFSSFDKLSFDADVFIVTATPSQAEILLRAMSYRNGKIWQSKGTPVLECAWLYLYPYVSGELNFTVTGFGSGMKARQILPDGLILLSIPYDLLSGMIENLRDMEWVLLSYTEGRDEHIKRQKRAGDALKQGFLTKTDKSVR